jgi:NAD(P)-dependent dehydrogenase (short-subunit alcohol dehydrogenase family)
MNTTQQPVAIITGASSGIGLGLTQALLERGWRVVGTSRTVSKSKELKPSPDLVLVDGEVSKKETAVKVVEAALKHFGRIDLLVNNAGIFIPKAFTDYTEEDYNLVMNTNVASFFYMTQQVIPQMKKQNSGHVVNISAVLVDQPSGALPAVLAVLSKSPMPAVSKALALEYAANNIRFNTVSPVDREVFSEPSRDGEFAIHQRKHPAQKEQRANLGSHDIGSQGRRRLWERQAEFAQAANPVWRRWNYYRPAWTPPSTRMFSPHLRR